MSRSLIPALMLLVAGTAAGCGGSESAVESAEGRGSESSSVSSATSSAAQSTLPDGPAAAAGLSEPLLPEAASSPGRLGAETFARYYWDVVGYAVRSGDLVPVRRLHAPGCSQCDGLADAIVDARRAGLNPFGPVGTVSPEAQRVATEWEVSLRAFTVGPLSGRWTVALAHRDAWRVTGLVRR